MPAQAGFAGGAEPRSASRGWDEPDKFSSLLLLLALTLGRATRMAVLPLKHGSEQDLTQGGV